MNIEQYDKLLELLERWVAVEELKATKFVREAEEPLPVEEEEFLPLEKVESLNFGYFKDSRIVRVVRDTKIMTDTAYNGDGFPIFGNISTIVKAGTLFQVHRKYQYGDGRNSEYGKRNTGWEIIGEAKVEPKFLSFPHYKEEGKPRYFLNFYDCVKVVGTELR